MAMIIKATMSAKKRVQNKVISVHPWVFFNVTNFSVVQQNYNSF